MVASALSADAPAPTPISTEDIAIIQALSGSLQEHQKQVQAAVAKQEARLCKEAAINRDACLVDWQKGTVGVKPKEEPKPAEKSKL